MTLSNLQAVQQVITNLLISHIEIRSEEALDIQQYLHERKMEKIVVSLEGEILEIKNVFKRVSIINYSIYNLILVFIYCTLYILWIVINKL